MTDFELRDAVIDDCEEIIRLIQIYIDKGYSRVQWEELKKNTNSIMKNLRFNKFPLVVLKLLDNNKRCIPNVSIRNHFSGCSLISSIPYGFMMTHFRVRHAVVEDCAEILRLIKELAEYEEMADEVNMTVEVLQKDGFGDSPVFKCLVVENLDSDGNLISGLIGYCLYYYLYSTWEGKCIYMEDLCVSPNSRRKGIGKSMMKRLAEVCVEEGCKRLQWAVLNWNTGAINFYKKTGAIDLTAKEGWHCYRLNDDGIKAFVAE